MRSCEFIDSDNGPSWMADKDKDFFNGLDSTLKDHEDIDRKVEDLIQEIPRYENPIKILMNLKLAWSVYDEEDKSAFLESIFENIDNDEVPDAQRGAMLSFLDYLLTDNTGDGDSDLLTL